MKKLQNLNEKRLLEDASESDGSWGGTSSMRMRKIIPAPLGKRE